MKQWTTDNYFCLASDSLVEHLNGAVPGLTATTPTEVFFGYCFADNTFHHGQRSAPLLDKLLNNYSDNCGVFAAILPNNGGATVFSDPLAQHPIFYYRNKDGFAVSNHWWWLARLPGLTINEECFNDYVTYQGPLLQQTLLSELQRLGPGQYLRLDEHNQPATSCMVKHRFPSDSWWQLPFEQLFEAGVTRLQQRAAALLRFSTPTAHLTGGMDSRLAFAALASQGFQGPVFSLGRGAFGDRQVFEGLVEHWQLSIGPVQRANRTVEGTSGLFGNVVSFNTLKSNNWSNGWSGSNFGHSEVTGYYSEGLLKAFGNFWIRGKIGMFDYGSRQSVFDTTLFDASRSRVRYEVRNLLELTNGNRPVVEQLHYLANRCAHHCGMQSVVSNRSFVSVDLLYDPVLLALLSAAPYEHRPMLQGALVMDLIKAVHSVDLACFPYDNRVIEPFNSWSQQEAIRRWDSCFAPAVRPGSNLPALPVIAQPDRLAQARLNDWLPGLTHQLADLSWPKVCALPLFDDFFAAYPRFLPGRQPLGSPRRPLEIVSLAALAANLHLITTGAANRLVIADD